MRTVPILLALAAIACSKSEAQAQAPTPAQAPAPAPAAPSTHAEGQGYSVEVKAPAEAPVGAEAKAQVVLTPTGGYHVNKEFPIVLAITAPAGVEVTKAKQQGADAAKLEESGAVFEVAFTPKEAGAKQFQASFRFAVCTPTTCDPKNVKLAWNVPIK
jgi:hypothetical protein